MSRQCPNCNETFLKRKSGRCPECGVEIEYQGDQTFLKAVFLEEKQKKIERTRAIREGVRMVADLITSRTKYVPAFTNVGTPEWREQASIAGAIYDRCATYLANQVIQLPITVYEFFIRLMQMILQDRYWHDHLETMAQAMYAAQKMALEIWRLFKVQWEELMANQRRITGPRLIDDEETYVPAL